MERFIVADEEMHDTPCQTERNGDRNYQDRWSQNLPNSKNVKTKNSSFETMRSSAISDDFDTINFGAASIDIDYILGIGTFPQIHCFKNILERDMMQNDPDFQASNSESGGPASELSRNSRKK